MSKIRSYPNRVQSRRRPPHPDDPLTLTLLHLGKPRSERMQHRLEARHCQMTNGLALRTELAKRYGWRCCKCGSTQHLQLDHIRPVSKGGKTEIDNLQLLCAGCNRWKGAQIIDFRPERKN